MNEDECDIFGNYVASKLRSFSDNRLKRKMERQITQVILNNLEEEEEEEEMLISQQQPASSGVQSVLHHPSTQSITASLHALHLHLV